MPTSIESVTIGAVEDRRIVLENAQIARLINIGTSWSTIRVGIRFAFDDLGASITGTPRFYIGMLASPNAGLTNGPLDATTSHFVGYISGSASWTRDAGDGGWYNSISTSGCYAKKVGATISTVAGSASNAGHSWAGTNRRNVFIVQIVKGAPNFTITICYPGGAENTGDITSPTNLIAAMESATLTGAASYLDAAQGFVGSYIGTATGNLAVNEATDGYLNAVCVAWNRSAPAVRISDLAWAKIA